MQRRQPNGIFCSVQAGKVNTCHLCYSIDDSQAALYVSPEEPAITVWVSETGSDDNDGTTQATAFATLNKAFDNLSRRHWQGGSVIMIDGTVSVAGGNLANPLYPRSSVSGNSGFILVQGANPVTLGPFTVASSGTWTAGNTNRPSFRSVTSTTSLGVADGSLRGSFIYFTTGGLAGVQVPIRDNVANTISAVLDLTPTAGDSFTICTPADTIDVSSASDIFITSLFPAPLCFRDLIMSSTGGGGYTSDDRSGYVILRRVVASVPDDAYLFDINVEGDGLYVTGTGAGNLMSFLVAKSQMVRVYFDGGNFQQVLPGIVVNQSWFLDTILAEGLGVSTPFQFVGGRGSMIRAAFLGSPVQIGLHTDLVMSNVGIDLSLSYIPLYITSSRVTLVDIEVLNGLDHNNVEIYNSTVVVPSNTFHVDGAGLAGIYLALASVLRCSAQVTGTGNGVVGINVINSSTARISLGSTISGPLSANFEVEGGGVLAFGAAPVTDASTLASLALF